SPFLVTEFVEGESLAQRLSHAGRLHEADALRITTGAAHGLHHLHEHGLIHRNVKPASILLRTDGAVNLPGLSLVIQAGAALTPRGLGNPGFLPPEQFRDGRAADVRGDLYGLATTLYVMLTGRLPFQANGPLDSWMKKVANDMTPPRQFVPEL